MPCNSPWAYLQFLCNSRLHRQNILCLAGNPQFWENFLLVRVLQSESSMSSPEISPIFWGYWRTVKLCHMTLLHVLQVVQSHWSCSQTGIIFHPVYILLSIGIYENWPKNIHNMWTKTLINIIITTSELLYQKLDISKNKLMLIFVSYSIRCHLSNKISYQLFGNVDEDWDCNYVNEHSNKSQC